MPEEPTELVLEEVVEVAPDKLSEEQTTYLRENTDDLSDDQKETFKDVLEDKEDEDVDPDDVKVQTRVPKKKKTDAPDDDDDEDDETDPEDKATIDKRVDSKLKPMQDRLDAQDKRSQKVANEVEVDAYIRDNPDFKKYRGVILKHMKHPDYSNVPASSIAAIVSAEDQQKIGAKKEREATEKARDTQSPGTTVRKPSAGEIDWSKAKPEDVAAKRQEILDKSRE